MIHDDEVKVYIASGHDNAAGAIALAKILKGIGCVVVSAWTERPIGYSDGIENTEKATHDVLELTKANVFVGLMNATSKASHAEFGFALAQGYPCFVTGDLNMLMYHPGVVQCANPMEIVDRLRMLVKAKQVVCDVCGAVMERLAGMLSCPGCGCHRRESPMAWKNELIKGHKAFCDGVAVDEGFVVRCQTCRKEWNVLPSGRVNCVSMDYLIGVDTGGPDYTVIHQRKVGGEQ